MHSGSNSGIHRRVSSACHHDKWLLPRRQKSVSRYESPRQFQIRCTYFRVFAQLCFDKTQKMLLIHTSRVMYVSIDFTNIIEVSVRHPLIKHIVKINVRCEPWIYVEQWIIPWNLPTLGIRSAMHTSSICSQGSEVVCKQSSWQDHR